MLEALDRRDEAQVARWSCFQGTLSAEHLRAYLKRLPDFDDVEAEERALDYAERYNGPLQALEFLLSWPALSFGTRHRHTLLSPVFPLYVPACPARLNQGFP